MNEENKGTEQSAATPPEPEISEQELRDDAERRDWVLQWFVGICNMTGIEIPITLNLGGSYVSGYVVKPDVYFDGILADLQSATFHGSAGVEIKKTLEQAISGMKEMTSPTNGTNEDLFDL